MNIPVVASVRGAVTTSQSTISSISSNRSTGHTAHTPGGGSIGKISTAYTSIPNAAARVATARPISPIASTPILVPANSMMRRT